MSMEDGKLEVNGVTYDVVTLDFETFYGKDYTLSGKINTSEYVRDDRFHVHGVAIKKGNGKTLWYTGRNIALALKEIDWSKTALVGHNTAFDGFITSEVYGHKPAFYVDTLSMSRATRGHATRHDLDTVAKAFGHGGKVKRDALANTKDKVQLTKDEEAKLGGYAVDDVDDTYKIFWDMYPHMPDDELRLVDITMRMFCDPVLEIDIPRVKAELENELGAKAAALLRSGAQVDDLMSNDKFARLLQAAGAQLPQKISPSTGKLTYAFAKSDLAFQDLMKNGNDKVRALCEARLKVKSTIGETRANRFLEAGRDGMKLPVMLNFSGAHTHRWSGGNKCLAGDTQITVLREGGVRDILLYKLLPDDRVWDGEEFVTHDGLLDQGEAEVITYDSITGTPDHEVFTDQGKITLESAREFGATLRIGSKP